ncbi:MAG: hypothetical protein O7B99_02265 [Planctomycetota bacterium]|nr:hypothetical protein [Planctomycetota bacterium]
MNPHVPILLLVLLAGAQAAPPRDNILVHGVTISCQTWGWEWGRPELDAELDDLSGLGVNWIAIHPSAQIHRNGRLTWRPIDPEDPPPRITRPIAEAHRRGMSILIKPHLSYWGSGFSWRGAIDFGPEARARFFEDYRTWIGTVAAASRGADAFVVGTELDRLVDAEDEWRRTVAVVRERFDGALTYAANWNAVERIPFWDALDAVGVQGYFPLSEADAPTEKDLRAGWERVLERLRAVHEECGKPVVFTELGYTRSLAAARMPWEARVAAPADAERAERLQLLCLRTGLDVLERESEWLRGCFLWKWFVGEPDGPDFLLDTPAVRSVMSAAWR